MSTESLLADLVVSVNEAVEQIGDNADAIVIDKADRTASVAAAAESRDAAVGAAEFVQGAATAVAADRQAVFADRTATENARDQAQTAVVSGRVTKRTLSDLQAVAGLYPDGAVGEVDTDGTNNGEYYKVGSVGEGTFVLRSRATVPSLDVRAVRADVAVTDVNTRSRRRVLLSSPMLARTRPTDAITVGDTAVSLRDSQGTEQLPQADAPRRVLAGGSEVLPFFGRIDEAGEFLGFTRDKQVRGKIDDAYARMGRTLAPAALPDAQIVETDGSGRVRRYTSGTSAVTDFGVASDPILTTEWIDAAGNRVAPLSAGSRELVVAYMPNGERRLLTPYGNFHFAAPRLAYGGKSVRAFKRRDGQFTGDIYAISIDGSGFMAPDDPDRLWVITNDGQSLAQGSGGLADFIRAWRTVLYPEHTLTLDNTVKPGDNRLGRNATIVDAVLDPATLGDFVPIKPQPGVASVHVYTPGEAFLLLLQDKIVRKLGRPQRMCTVTLGVGGQSIAAIGSGTPNETNKRTAQTAIRDRAAARGWRVNFVANHWLHGESDATNLTATYLAALTDYQDRDAAFVKDLTGQTNDPVWLISQNSSTGEDADNETTSIGALAFPQMMRANPARNLVYGPDYPYQAYYADFTHFVNEGYFRKSEVACAAFVHQVWGCGGLPGLPLYLLGASYTPGSTTITLQWSRPIVRDATLVPTRPFDGVEVATSSNVFLTITDHAIVAGASTSTLTLQSALTTGQQAAARVQIGLLGQATPRTADTVPGTNIRAATSHDTAEIDGLPIRLFALHDRLPLTLN